jgi:hypothetical protein
MMGPFASVLAHSRAGIAAKYKLDILTARREFREAFEIGARVGSHSHAARLSGALHGELLYEAGELDETHGVNDLARKPQRPNRSLNRRCAAALTASAPLRQMLHEDKSTPPSSSSLMRLSKGRKRSSAPR